MSQKGGVLPFPSDCGRQDSDRHLPFVFRGDVHVTVADDETRLAGATTVTGIWLTPDGCSSLGINST